VTVAGGGLAMHSFTTESKDVRAIDLLSETKVGSSEM